MVFHSVGFAVSPISSFQFFRLGTFTEPTTWNVVLMVRPFGLFGEKRIERV